MGCLPIAREKKKNKIVMYIPIFTGQNFQFQNISSFFLFVCSGYISQLIIIMMMTILPKSMTIIYLFIFFFLVPSEN